MLECTSSGISYNGGSLAQSHLHERRIIGRTGGRGLQWPFLSYPILWDGTQFDSGCGPCHLYKRGGRCRLCSVRRSVIFICLLRRASSISDEKCFLPRLNVYSSAMSGLSLKRKRNHSWRKISYLLQNNNIVERVSVDEYLNFSVGKYLWNCVLTL